jgi:hypothetical protein
MEINLLCCARDDVATEANGQKSEARNAKTPFFFCFENGGAMWAKFVCVWIVFFS